MIYYIQDREKGMYMVWNKEKGTDEWQREREGATPFTKDAAIAKARELKLSNAEYRIIN